MLHRLRHPHTTVRWRLTLIYGGLFLACGAGLLAITYALVARADVIPNTAFVTRPPRFLLSRLPSPGSTVSGAHVRPRIQALPPQVRKALRSSAGQRAVNVVLNTQHHEDLHRLEVESGIALAIMTLISGLLGWLVAGRILRPLRTITATTRELSEANLDRRLALRGPPDELRQLADTIDGLLARLEAAFEAQRRFVANASHELRTPLTTVRALLEMVMSDPHATLDTFRETCRQVLEENEHEERSDRRPPGARPGAARHGGPGDHRPGSRGPRGGAGQGDGLNRSAASRSTLRSITPRSPPTAGWWSDWWQTWSRTASATTSRTAR